MPPNDACTCHTIQMTTQHQSYIHISLIHHSIDLVKQTCKQQQGHESMSAPHAPRYIAEAGRWVGVYNGGGGKTSVPSIKANPGLESVSDGGPELILLHLHINTYVNDSHRPSVMYASCATLKSHASLKTRHFRQASSPPNSKNFSRFHLRASRHAHKSRQNEPSSGVH